MLHRKLSALFVLSGMIAACLPLSTATLPAAAPETPSSCAWSSLQLPQADPAWGGYDAGPGPKIGEAPPIAMIDTASCASSRVR